MSSTSLTSSPLSSTALHLKQCLSLRLAFLGICNFWSGEEKDLLFLAMVCKHFILVAFLCFVTWVVFVVTAPEF
jgi:hypothetical protein